MLLNAIFTGLFIGVIVLPWLAILGIVMLAGSGHEEGGGRGGCADGCVGCLGKPVGLFVLFMAAWAPFLVVKRGPDFPTFVEKATVVVSSYLSLGVVLLLFYVLVVRNVKK